MPVNMPRGLGLMCIKYTCIQYLYMSTCTLLYCTDMYMYMYSVHV